MGTKVFHVQADAVGQVDFCTCAVLCTPQPLIAVHRGEAVGSVGRGEFVVDPAIRHTTGGVEKTAAITGRDTEACAKSASIIDLTGNGVARRRRAEPGGVIGSVRLRTFQHHTGYEHVADATVHTDLDGVAQFLFVVAAGRRSRTGIRPTVAQTGRERICTGNGAHDIVVFTVAVGVESQTFVLAIVDGFDAERAADIDAVEVVRIAVLREGRLSDCARQNGGCQKCRFFH